MQNELAFLRSGYAVLVFVIVFLCVVFLRVTKGIISNEIIVFLF